MGGSKAKEAAEDAIKRIQGQFRTVRIAFEDAVCGKIREEPNVRQWLVEFAADTFNRCKANSAGIIPYREVKGRDSNTPVAAFGERVYYHMNKQMTSIRPKSEPARLEGIYPGALWMSNG